MFAPAAARLALGDPVEGLGPLDTDPRRVPLPVPRRSATEVVGEVVYVEYGTLVTNLTPELVRDARQIMLDKQVVPIRQTFGDVAPGGAVAFIGSGGTIEIAVRDGSASRTLQADRNAAVRVGLDA